MQTFIFTDGASKGNPGQGGWGGVIQKGNKVEEIGGRESLTTNNRMELTAVTQSLLRVEADKGGIVVFTDSSYVINGITKWIHGWEKNNWKTKNKTDVLNIDLWKPLSAMTKELEIEWVYVPGHSDVSGNERANDIAEAFALGRSPELYRGVTAEYTTKLLQGEKPLDKEGNIASLKKDTHSKKRKTGAAYSYVSVLNGKVETHKTWNECKVRVEGKPARFKKALSKKEEEEIISEYKR
ncbi:MAG: ribonuclease H [Candidatus Paceibacterota bacterium]